MPGAVSPISAPRPAPPGPGETVLHAFENRLPMGADPFGNLTRGAAGNLYGTAVSGGPAGGGEVFKINPAGHLSVIYSFTGGADGQYPDTQLTRDPAGNLYGTTQGGGNQEQQRKFHRGKG